MFRRRGQEQRNLFLSSSSNDACRMPHAACRMLYAVCYSGCHISTSRRLDSRERERKTEGNKTRNSALHGEPKSREEWRKENGEWGSDFQLSTSPSEIPKYSIGLVSFPSSPFFSPPLAGGCFSFLFPSPVGILLHMSVLTPLPHCPPPSLDERWLRFSDA